jgi:hypothetical protein
MEIQAAKCFQQPIVLGTPEEISQVALAFEGVCEGCQLLPHGHPGSRQSRRQKSLQDLQEDLSVCMSISRLYHSQIVSQSCRLYPKPQI